MRHFLIVLPLLSLFACKESFVNVEEACDDSVPGEAATSNVAAIATFKRINCYRRLVKLGQARLDKHVQEAAENHMLYIEANESEYEFAGVGIEEPGQTAFTGKEVYDRLAEVGYPDVSRSTLDVWEWRYIDEEEAADRVDFWFPDPFARQAYLTPSWVGGGYAEGETLDEDDTAYLTIFFSQPVTEASGKPVIYPMDGQVGVPTRFTPVDPSRVIYDLGEVGYPISVTVGSTSGGSGVNPHNMELHNVRLTGPDGEVELHTETPLDGQLSFTMGFYPAEPLVAGADYTFFVKLSWELNEAREYTSTFRTGADSDGLPSRLDRPTVMPKLTHRQITLPQN